MNNKVKIVSLFLIFCASLPDSQIAFAKCGANINAGIQKIIDGDRVKYNIPGMQVSISCPDEKLPRDFVSGTTTMDGTVPVAADHLFQIGSETKSFIAAIMLQLEAEGLLSIHDPIERYLPFIPKDWENVTIQQLLNQTSGLYNYTEVEEVLEIIKSGDIEPDLTAEKIINFVTNKTPYFKPGTGWHYSNTNYVLAGMVINAVTGKSVEEEINARLLKPAQLSNTFYMPRAYSEDILQRMAHGYAAGGLLPDEPKDITRFNISWANAAGAILSTSHDTAIWLRQLLTTHSILPDIQRQELMELVDMENGQAIPKHNKKMGYGLGLAYDPSAGEIWGHSGGTLGYLSNMYWLKCNDVVITTIINRTDKDGVASAVLLNDLGAFIQNSDSSSRCNDGDKTRSFILWKVIK